MFGILGFDFSSVDELESFVVFEKIWGIRSSGPKILLKICVGASLFIGEL